MTGTIQALVHCKSGGGELGCPSTEVGWAYPLDKVRMLRGEAICQTCYVCRRAVGTEVGEDGDEQWSDLPCVALADLKL